MSFSKEFLRGVKEEIAEPFTVSVYLKGKYAYVDGFTKVSSLRSKAVIFSSKKNVITVEGEDIEIERLEENSVLLKGNICAIREEVK